MSLWDAIGLEGLEGIDPFSESDTEKAETEAEISKINEDKEISEARKQAVKDAYVPQSQEIDPRVDEDKRSNYERNVAVSQLQNQQAEQAGSTNIATPNAVDTREGEGRLTQQELISMLEAQARGEGPSLAQDQLRRAQQDAMSQALALQGFDRNQDASMAGRNASRAFSEISSRANADSATLALQEQLAARGLLGQVAGSMRAGDQGFDLANADRSQNLNITQAQLDQQTELANAQLRAQQQAQMNDLVAKYIAMGMSQADAVRAAQMEAERLALSERQGFIGADQAATAAQQQYDLGHRSQDLGLLSSIVGGVGGGVGSAVGAAVSDKNAKEGIKKEDPENMSKFLSTFLGSFGGDMRRRGDQMIAMSDVDNKTNIQAVPTALPGLGMKSMSMPGASVVEQGANFLNGTGGAIRLAEDFGKGMGDMTQAGGLSTPRLRLGMLSDENKKTNVDPISQGDFLSALKAYNYDYKEPEKYGDGEHLGVMAQDLLKTPEGRSMVYETPQGLVVDGGKMAGAALASSAYLNERQDEFEEVLKQILASEKKGKK